MVINFQQNRPDFAPILIQGQTTVRVEKAIILGMSITQDLKWNEHVNNITKKAAKRLYLLKQLKRSGLDSKDLKCFLLHPSERSSNMLARSSIMAYLSIYRT